MELYLVIFKEMGHFIYKVITLALATETFGFGLGKAQAYRTTELKKNGFKFQKSPARQLTSVFRRFVTRLK